MAALLVATNLFWAFVFNRLVNKLMSRSFLEYKEAIHRPDKLKVDLEKAKLDVNVNDFEDYGSLTEIAPMG